ncbi:DNA topoisomerase 3-beta-1-like [Anneissia japonica]|uniref:DNA topoisomerase 3-beta-1-like n=1 Tax=Anneissia japonica TaxID=1529436 RepID=UPI00142587A6|nr:DNA topoisomerase 3-beta-1-like [Anneissia japonica]XP_033112817.1 DNA topoisomerase 3-beta-1-like [Anneissia japonica]
MKVALMVAEKPQLAHSLAKILSNGNMNSRKGMNGACSVHEYDGRFQGESCKFKMTSVCGHVLGLDFQPRYNNWDRVDPVELFEAETEKKETNPNLQMPKFLSREGHGVDYLILWLDCDKEGENICFEVIGAVKPNMNRSRSSEKTIFRAKFSAITESDVKGAMKNLGDPNRNEAMSVDARLELDLRIGCAFTRFQTKFFQGKYGNLDSNLISYGPCQTPTLGFCVNRHDQIQSFKPELYWVLQVQANHPSGRKLNLDWERVRLFDKEVAQLFLNMVKNTDTARVLSVSKKEKSKQRPLALNTVEMLRVASSGLGMSPQHTMQIAERLYIQGYISYPRTETTHYPEQFDLKGTLRQQQHSPNWGDDVKELLTKGINKARKGHDAGDHPPITPMRSASESEIGGEAWRLYDYITRHFIATISYDCKYLQTTAKLAVGDESFTCTGKTLLDLGYTSVMHWQQIPSEENLPDFQEGQVCNVDEVKLVEKQTSPPDYLTESELITLMEKHGIGTDASIPVHINNICQRNYVSVVSGRKLKPTDLGIVLVHGYQKIDPDLSLPTMRSAVEQQLNLIAAGKADFNLVLDHTLGIFQRKFSYFVEQIKDMDELFEVSFSPLAASGKPLSRCGKCHRYMKYIQAKPSRLHCATCNETYSLPHNGVIKLYKEIKCPLDDFELVMYSSGTKSGKNYPLCPYCFSHPPFQGMKKGSGCNECTHPTCQHSLSKTGVAKCGECEYGILVLDVNSAPKWKMACNRCSFMVRLFTDAHKIALVADSRCEGCNAAIMSVEFNKAKTPLEGEETHHLGCAFCDPIFSSLIKTFHQAARPVSSTRGRGGTRGGGGGRGGGSGRGRRGRGRGRGGRDKLDF